jgi:hypothetical protein
MLMCENEQMVIASVTVLAIAVVECLCGFGIGVIAKERRWSLRRTYWLCWVVGLLGACALGGVTRLFLSPHTAGFVSGLSVSLSLLVWVVCARIAGFRVDQMNEEQHQITTLHLSDRRPQ